MWFTVNHSFPGLHFLLPLWSFYDLRAARNKRRGYWRVQLLVDMFGTFKLQRIYTILSFVRPKQRYRFRISTMLKKANRLLQIVRVMPEGKR